MKIFVTSFWLPKAGNTHDEYEDAFYPHQDGEHQGIHFCFAVADGASEGILSGKWAEILVKSFCRFVAPHSNFKGLLERVYKDWNFWKKSYLHNREKRKSPIQWYEEPGLQAGAFSTFLGLMLTDRGEELPKKWNAIAIGDSCLFQVRDEILLTRFPLTHSSEFNNRPLLISTNPPRNNGVLEAINIKSGNWCIEDRFYLMTDALASWFLQEYEADQAPWRILRDFDTIDQQQSFKEWIHNLREKNQMRNDDVTLIRLDIV
jgi:hypothetical protein